MSRTRQLILLIVVAFLIYAVINSPGSSAHVVNESWVQVKHGLHQVGLFFNALIHQSS